MSVDFIASELQYLHHLLPVHREMPGSRMLLGKDLGFTGIPRSSVFLGKSGIVGKLRESSGPIVVASYKDFLLTDQTRRPVILMEHGAGQSYSSTHTSYVGGVGRGRAAAILSPGELSHEKNSASYPTKLCLAPGSPRIDELLRIPQRSKKVVFSFHWDCSVCPETRSAFPFYKHIIPEIAKKFDVIVHSHPRIAGVVSAFCEQFGLQFVPAFENVVGSGDLYICDNSSTIFEWAAIGRPVILLNCPHYRKFVRHGLRFWDFAEYARSVEITDDLASVIREVFQDRAQVVQRQNEYVLKKVYNNVGDATGRVISILQMPEFYKEAKGSMAKEEKTQRIPTIMMVGNKRFEDAEGGIHEGVKFHPGWAHKAYLIGPRRHDIELIPIAPIPGMNEENRAAQLEQRGLATRVPMPDEIRMVTPPAGGVYMKAGSTVANVRTRLSPHPFQRGKADATQSAPKAEIKTVSTSKAPVNPDVDVNEEVDEEEVDIKVVDHPETEEEEVNEKEAPSPQDDKMDKEAPKAQNKMANAQEETKTSKKRNPKGVRYSS